jgi:hypothetical protein
VWSLQQSKIITEQLQETGRVKQPLNHSGAISDNIKAAREIILAPIEIALSSTSKIGECNMGHSPSPEAHPRRN